MRFKLPDEWLSFELRDIVREVLDLIQEHDAGYVFSTSRVNLGVNGSKASFVAYCSLSTIQERTRKTNPAKNARKQLLHDCNGSITGKVDMEKSVVNLVYRHEELHELPKQESKSDPEVVEYIASIGADTDLACVRRNIRMRYPNTVMTPKQISYWFQVLAFISVDIKTIKNPTLMTLKQIFRCFQVATRSQYVKDEHQIESAKLLIQEYEAHGSHNVSNAISRNEHPFSYHRLKSFTGVECSYGCHEGSCLHYTLL